MPRNELSAFEKKARHEIAENLKKYMHGMTQSDLAAKAGIPLTTLSGYIREKSTPNAGNLEKLASALNVKKSNIDPRYALVKEEEYSVHEPTINYEISSKDHVNDEAEAKVLTMFRKSTEGMNEDEKLRFQQSLDKLMSAAKDLNKPKE